MAVKIDNLADVILQELQAYSDDVAAGLKKEVKAVAKACVAEIQSKAPVDTGEYREGWQAKRSYESNDDIRMTVHNKTHPQRGHLLEDGHANVDGGRTPGTPHINPAAEHAAKTLEERAKVVCRVSG